MAVQKEKNNYYYQQENSAMGTAIVWILFGCGWGEVRWSGKPDLEGTYLSAKDFEVYLKVNEGLFKVFRPLGYG